MDYLRSYKNVYDPHILLLFKGELTFDLVTAMIATLKDRLKGIEEDNTVRKRFYKVATECIQNLYFHLEEVNDFEREVEGIDARAALVLISARKRFYSLETGNYIPTVKTYNIKERLDGINRSKPDELDSLYKKALGQHEFGPKGTGGLGFIDIARKTGGQKLRYKFQPLTDLISYFTLQVRVPRD